MGSALGYDNAIKFAIDSILYKEELIFNWYWRMKILSQFFQHKIIDEENIYRLCRRFFYVTAHHLNVSNATPIQFIADLRVECIRNKEYLIGYELSNILIDTDYCAMPTVADGYASKAVILALFGDVQNKDTVQNIIKFHELSLKSKPRSLEYHEYYILSLLRINNLANMEKLELQLLTMMELIADKPNIDKIYIHLCYYHYAQFYRDHVKDYQKARRYYLKCLQIRKKFGTMKSLPINAEYGYILYLLGHYQKAKRYVEKELKMGTNSLVVHFYHALIFEKLDDPESRDKSLMDALHLVRDRFRCRNWIHRLQSTDSPVKDTKCCRKFEKMLLNRMLLFE